MSFSNDTKITLDVTVNTSLENAWNVWNDPQHITKWNFASDDWHCPSASNDLREGGKLSSRMEAKDGSFGFDFEGTYTKVIPHQLLEYHLEDGRPVQVRFEEKGDAVVVTETFQTENSHTVEQQKEGWQNILDNFKKHAESI